MILDNSGIDYSRMLYSCLVFLFTGKLNQILAPSRASATPGLLLDYKAVTSKLSKKHVTSQTTIVKVLVQEIIFPLRFSIGK